MGPWAQESLKVNLVHMLRNHDMQPDGGGGVLSRTPSPKSSLHLSAQCFSGWKWLWSLGQWNISSLDERSLWQPLNVDNRVSHWVRKPRFVKKDGFWPFKDEDERISVSWLCCHRLCHHLPFLPVDGTDGRFFFFHDPCYFYFLTYYFY